MNSKTLLFRIPEGDGEIKYFKSSHLADLFFESKTRVRSTNLRVSPRPMVSHKYLCIRTDKIRNYDTNVNKEYEKNAREDYCRRNSGLFQEARQRRSQRDSATEGSFVWQTFSKKTLIRRVRRSKCEERRSTGRTYYGERIVPRFVWEEM